MIKSANGEMLVEPEQIADRWKEYTQDLYAVSNGGMPHMATGEKEPPPLKSEVVKAMNSLNSNKAPGPK